MEQDRKSDDWNLSSARLGVAVCDDDPKDRAYYADLIRTTAQEQGIPVEIYTFESGKETLFHMEDRKQRIDILYLDICMPDEDGMQIAKRLRDKESAAYFPGEIIFLTGAKEFAIAAFDVQAFHYMIKGITPTEKFQRIFLQAAARSTGKRKKQLLLRGGGEYRNIDVDSIHYLEVFHRIITIHYSVPERKFEFYSPMEKMEEVLLPFGFLRVHRSYIIRVSEVESISREQLILHGSQIIPIGRTYYQELKLAYDGMIAKKEVIRR